MRHAMPSTICALTLAALAGCPGDPPRPPGSTPESGGSTYVKSYSVEGQELAVRNVVATPDGGSYQLAGLLRNAGVGGTAEHSLAIMRLDSVGDVMWARRYGRRDVTGGLSRIVGAVEAPGGHVWVAGPSVEGATVIELDAAGQALAHYVYDTPERPIDIAAIGATGDGGFVLVGSSPRTPSTSDAPKGGDLRIIWVNANGMRDQTFDGEVTHDDDGAKVLGIEVFANEEVTVVGELPSENRRLMDFWVARFRSTGAMIFSHRYDLGSAKAVVSTPFGPGSGAAKPSIVVVGAKGGAASPNTSRLVYQELTGVEGGVGDILQDEVFDVASLGTTLSYVAVALRNDLLSVVAATNSYEGSRVEGILQVLERSSGTFTELRTKSASQLAQEGSSQLGLAGASFQRMERTPRGDLLLLYVTPSTQNSCLVDGGDCTAGNKLKIVRLTNDLGTPTGFGTLDTWATDLRATADDGALVWSERELLRLDASGQKLWTLPSVHPSQLSADPVGVAPLTDGGALVAATTFLRTAILKYDKIGELKAAREYDAELGALAPLDLDRDGLRGDGVLAVGSCPSAPDCLLRLRLGSSGNLLDAAAIPGVGSVGPVSTAGDRILVRAGDGALWLDERGEVTAHWRFGSAGELRATPDGGLWRLESPEPETGYGHRIEVQRYDRNGQASWSRSVAIHAADLGDGSPRLDTLVWVNDTGSRADGGLFLTGAFVVPADGGVACGDAAQCSDGLIASLDWTGQVSWVRGYGAARREQFGRDAWFSSGRTLAGTSDNGLLALGTTNSYELNSFGFPRVTLFAARVDADGQVEASCIAQSDVSLEATVVDGEPAPAVTFQTSAFQPTTMPASEDLEFASDPLDVVTARSCHGDSEAPSVIVTVRGEGSVVSAPVGIDCPGDCDQAWARGSVIGLRAEPAADSEFVGWGGDCASFGRTTPIALPPLVAEKSLTCSARFAAQQQQVTGGCQTEADCAEPCRTECGGEPLSVYCESHESHKCFCTCEEQTSDCVVDDPRPECGGHQVEACGAGTGVVCVTLEIDWTINGAPADRSVCETGAMVELAVSKSEDTVACDSRKFFVDVPPGEQQVDATLRDASGAIVDTEVVSVFADAPFGVTELVTVPFATTGSVEVSWTVNGGATNCLPGSVVQVTALTLSQDIAGQTLPNPSCEAGRTTLEVLPGDVTLMAILSDAALINTYGTTNSEVVTVTKDGTHSVAIDVICATCPNAP